MTHDRYGERIEQCPNGCRNGWLSAPDADVAVACPCRWQRADASNANTTSDTSTGRVSARAQAAIDAADRGDTNPGRHSK